MSFESETRQEFREDTWDDFNTGVWHVVRAAHGFSRSDLAACQTAIIEAFWKAGLPWRTAPKAVARQLRDQVFERDSYRCGGCGSPENLSIDHIIPASLGGPSIEENLRVLCRPCNSKKGARLDA